MLVRYISQARIKQIRKSARKKLPKLIKKQRGFCAICGRKMNLDLVGIHTQDDSKPTVDHIIDIEFGGGNTDSNLRAVHDRCNQAANAAKMMMKAKYFGGGTCIECGLFRSLNESGICGKCNKKRRTIRYYIELFWVKGEM